MNTEIINVLDTVSFETADGLDYLTGIVWAIEAHTITFRVRDSFHAVPRALAEQSTVLIEKFSREAVIAELLEAIA